MPKSEYSEPKKLPGERPYPQILNDAEELYGLLLTAETMMTKVDKIRYNNRAVDQILDVIKEFVLAYDFEDDREIHLKRMCANVAVFIRTMRNINDRNIISSSIKTKGRKMTRQEIEDRKNVLFSLVRDREAKLRETDYVAAKIAEGAATQKEYAETLSMRQKARIDINAAQEELVKLDNEEPEDEVEK